MSSTVGVISACSGSKAVDPVVGCADIESWSREELVDRNHDDSLPARELYTGDEHQHVEEAVALFEEVATVRWRIASAGFGLVHPATVLPGYECTFRDADAVEQRVERTGRDPESLTRREQLRHAGAALGIPDDVRAVLDGDLDVAYVLLGRDYLIAASDGLEGIPGETPVYAFAPEGSRELVGACQWVPSTDAERDALGTTWTRVKGRQLRNVARAVAGGTGLGALRDVSTIHELSVQSR